MTQKFDQLNTNTRLLKVGPGGFSVSSGVLCNSCGVRSLCRSPHKASGGALSPLSCADFSPLFVFRSPLIGFDGFFNTFRLGRGNFDRFHQKIGTIATLYEKRRGRILGYAKVVGAVVAPMEIALALHAHTNHLCIGKGISKGEAPDWLREVLLKNYKTMFKTADRTDPFSIIFMTRCAEPAKGFNSVATCANHTDNEAA